MSRQDQGHARRTLALLLIFSLTMLLLQGVALAGKPGGGSSGKATSLSLSAPGSATAYTDIEIAATLTSKDKPLSGQTVTLSVNGYYAGGAMTDSLGVARFTYTLGTVGTHTLVADFAGARGYQPSQATATVEATEPPPEPAPAYTVTVTATTATYGDPTTLEAQLDPPASERVEFRLGDTLLGTTVSDASGLARLTWTVDQPAGGYTLDAVVVVTCGVVGFESTGGGTTCGSSGSGSLTIVPKRATLIYTGDTEAKHDASLTLSVQVTPEGGTSGDIRLAGPIRFDLYTPDSDSPIASYTAAVDEWGVAAVTTGALPYQTYFVEAYQDGTDNRYYQTGRIRQTIDAPVETTLTVPNETVQSHDWVTLKATLTAGTEPLAGRSVTFALQGDPFATVTTNDYGVASLNFWATMASGDATITASYSGEAAYKASSGSGTLTVTPESATLSYTGDTRFNTDATLRLQAVVTEEQDGTSGNLEWASPVIFTLTRKSDGAVAGTWQANTNPNGVAEVLVGPLPVEPYTLTVALSSENRFYKAEAVTVEIQSP